MFSLNEVQLDTANQILTAFDLKLSLPSDVNVDFRDPFNPAVSGRICGIDDLAANDRTFDFFDNYAFHFTRNP